MGIGVGELLIILLVVLIIFGAGRLSELGTALPKAVKNFQAGARGELVEEPSDAAEPPTPTTPRAPRRRLRPLGMVTLGLGLLLFYADAQWLQVGLPLQVAAGALGVVGIVLFLFF
ncbi:MAG: twin-arginine translocase TatA/TatE family subunit [Chloroflexota bacterium]|nr:twin-arginine translocase TatA/TatE family subunit [Dehalococcoidia bacterium]MDW8254391.1 twin-arginine translocase TatA/TatE family subunit [Chloroflexota bacterium]